MTKSTNTLPSLFISLLFAMLTFGCERDASESFPKKYSYKNIVSASDVSFFSLSGQAISNVNAGSALSLFEQKADAFSADISEVIPITDIELASISSSILSNNDPASAYYGFSESFDYLSSGSEYTFLVDTTTNNFIAKLEGDTLKCKVLCYTYSGNKPGAFIPSMVFFFDQDFQKNLIDIKTQVDLQPGDTVAVKYYDLLYIKE